LMTIESPWEIIKRVGEAVMPLNSFPHLRGRRKNMVYIIIILTL